MVREKLQHVPCEILENQSLKEYSTFHIGGLVKYVILLQDVDYLGEVLQVLVDEKIPHYFIGSGANILFKDVGFNGALIKMQKKSSKVIVEGTSLIADSGISLMDLCSVAQKHSLTGLEFAYGIPGTVGGATFMNAGAYDGEMKDIVEKVWFIDATLQDRALASEQLEFGYRVSYFSKHKGYIKRVKIRLQKGDQQDIKRKMEDLFSRRITKQPYYEYSVGSTFKRPNGSYASYLIDTCGLRGRRIGGAMVSEKHCGFIVNVDHATSSDILNLVSVIQKEVKEKTGYTLECEMKVIGD